MVKLWIHHEHILSVALSISNSEAADVTGFNQNTFCLKSLAWPILHEGNVNKTELNSVDLITFTTLPIKRQLKHHKNTKIKTNRCTHFRKGKKSKGAWLRRFRKKMAGLHTSSMRRDISHFEYFRIEKKQETILINVLRYDKKTRQNLAEIRNGLLIKGCYNKYYTNGFIRLKHCKILSNWPKADPIVWNNLEIFKVL